MFPLHSFIFLLKKKLKKKVLLYFCSNKCHLEKSDSDFFQNIKKFLQPKIFKW